MAVTYSSGNYHTVADAAGLTLPNGDWSWVFVFLTGSDITTGQDIFANGDFGVANEFTCWIGSSSFNIQLDTGLSQSTAIAASTWYIGMLRRLSGTLTIHHVPMGTTTLTSSAGTSISAAYNSPNALFFGRTPDNAANPFLGSASDFIFIPGTGVPTSDLQDIATSTAIDSKSWWASRELHAIVSTASSESDHTGNHTVTKVGTPPFIADSTDLVRFGAIDVNQASEANTGFSITWVKSLPFGLSNETDSATTVDKSKSLLVPLSNETDSGQVIVPDFSIIVNIDLANETDTGQIITPDFPNVAISLANETNTAQDLNEIKTIAIPQVSESNTSFPVINSKIQDVNLASETDSAFSSDFFKVLALGFAVETDSAFQISRIGGAIDILTVDNAGVKILIDDKIKSSTLSATSTATGFDVDNLKSDNKNDIWRSTSLSTQVITATWATPELLSGVGFVFSNLIVGSTVRIKLYANSGDVQAFAQTPILNVTFAYDIPHGFSSIGYASFPFGGGNYFSSFFDESSVGKLEVTLTSPGNPDNAMELARIVAGPILSLTSRPDYGASVGQVDRTLNTRADGGDLVSDRGTQSKEVKLALSKLTRGDALLYNSIMRAVDRGIPIYVSVVGDDFTDEDITSYQIYGQRDKNLSISPISHNRNSSNITLTEI